MKKPFSSDSIMINYERHWRMSDRRVCFLCQNKIDVWFSISLEWMAFFFIRLKLWHFWYSVTTCSQQNVNLVHTIVGPIKSVESHTPGTTGASTHILNYMKMNLTINRGFNLERPRPPWLKSSSSVDDKVRFLAPNFTLSNWLPRLSNYLLSYLNWDYCLACYNFDSIETVFLLLQSLLTCSIFWGKRARFIDFFFLGEIIWNSMKNGSIWINKFRANNLKYRANKCTSNWKWIWRVKKRKMLYTYDFNRIGLWWSKMYERANEVTANKPPLLDCWLKYTGIKEKTHAH